MKPVINEYCRQSGLQSLESINSPSKITIEEARSQCKEVLNEIGREPLPGDPLFEKYIQSRMDIIGRILQTGNEVVARETYASTSAFFRDEYGVQIPPFAVLEKNAYIWQKTESERPVP